MSRAKQLDLLQKQLGRELIFSSRIIDVCDIFHLHDAPYDGYVSFFTVGLAEHARHELVMSCRPTEVDACKDSIALLAFTITNENIGIASHSLVKGDGDLPDLSGKAGFYLTESIYFSVLAADGLVLFAIPVTTPEINIIQSNGWEAFEALLDAREDIDLLQLAHHSLSFKKKVPKKNILIGRYEAKKINGRRVYQ